MVIYNVNIGIYSVQDHECAISSLLVCFLNLKSLILSFFAYFSWVFQGHSLLAYSGYWS